MTKNFEVSLSSGGSIVCTTPAPKVYLLTFTAPPDNRLVSGFCDGMILALDIIEKRFDKGVVITTSGIPKFYSNGLDLDHAGSTEGFFPDKLYKMFARFLMFPMPTIALINGHAFAAGFMLSMFHDYRVFNATRGFVCLNEIDFGVPLKSGMSSIFRIKLAPQTYRHIVLEAKRFGGKDALAEGIVDILGGLDEALQFIEQKKLYEKGASNIYNLMKIEMYKESLADLQGWDRTEKEASNLATTLTAQDEETEARVKNWEQKSKL